MKYFLVDAMFGHVGKNKYIVKTIAVIKESKKEASNFVRWMPRVKHHRKDAIISVKEVTYDEYLETKIQNNNDNYFKATNIQEQRLLCSDLEENINTFRTNIEEQEFKRKKSKFKMEKNKKINKELNKYVDSYVYQQSPYSLLDYNY